MTQPEERWQITLPDGKVLTFPDWQTARIEAMFYSSTLGVVLVPEPVKEEPE